MMTPEQLAAKRVRGARYRAKLASDPGRLEQLRERGRRNSAAFYERNKAFLDFLERRRAYQRDYNRSEAGRAVTARWRETENGRAYLRLKEAARSARRAAARPAKRGREAKSLTAIHAAARHVEEMRTALLSDALYAAANRVVPHSLPAFIRDDVISDLCLGVLEGAFPAEEMARYVKPLTAQHRGVTSKFGDRSLEDRVGEVTLGQQLGIY